MPPDMTSPQVRASDTRRVYLDAAEVVEREGPVDEAKQRRAGQMAMVSSALGIFCDLYFLTLINLVKDLVGEARGVPLTVHEKSLLGSVIYVGTVLGQLCFGTFADQIGRRVICIVTCICMMIGALGSSLSVHTSWCSLTAMLCAFQLLLGFGIGGEYPLSASVTSESSSPETSGRRAATVYSMMGVGGLVSPLVIWSLLSAGLSARLTWRLSLAIGCLPCLLAFTVRWNMMESDRFRATSALRRQKGSFYRYLKRLRFHLVGTAVAWAVYDIVIYGIGTFMGEITVLLNLGSGPKAEALNTLAITAFSSPGYALSIVLVETLGRKNCQTAGFTGMGVFFGLLAVALGVWGVDGTPAMIKVTLFTLAMACNAAGPGMSTYVIPGEFFPSVVKGTFHGISAASGKMGAVLGGFMYAYLTVEPQWITMAVSGGLSLIGAVWTIIFIPQYSVRELRSRLEEEKSDILSSYMTTNDQALLDLSPSPDGGASDSTYTAGRQSPTLQGGVTNGDRR
ncbi:unnamed protein product [Vitrella brassicaformis CCMP3155]|uniref:Major facilitator superfamily (MFS) profile domain-containing protein n=2 Tax=Vitrella brassicaformis TaxID=1169539 RepID=A0A0G4EMX6_VITBC|nr:unnamed protein product [Vitrella brassicaformis CCMP3155]|eukprot:CEL98521.1 unnamed protein product [Vitrella brassicaformis CCMP3155]